MQTNKISLKHFILGIQDVLNYLLSKKVVIVCAMLLGMCAGAYYAISKKPVFISRSTFVLEDSGSDNALAQYAGIASIVGLDLGASNNGIFQVDNIMELYKSRLMIEKTLFSNADFNGQKMLLIEKYLKIKDIKKNWRDRFKLKNFKYYTNNNSNRLQDSIVNFAFEDIKKNFLIVDKLDKKLNIIKVEVKSEDELFSKYFNVYIVKNVNDFYVSTKTKKALQNLQILQHQTDSIRSELNRAVYGVAKSIDTNPNANPLRQMLRVPTQKKQIDAEANKAILSELVTNLEIAKVSLRRESPLIQMIDKPILPLDKKKPSLLICIFVGVFFTTLVTISFLVIKRSLIKVLDEDN